MPDGGGGSSECLPMDDLVGAMLRNSQALAEALAVDRARREAALKEKDAEIDRLRAESADVKKKLQADASRKMRWEEAYELLLGANQKLAELRDADMADSRTCAEIPNSKEVESFTKLSQNTVDHTASDFGKLKQDYETLSSKKDKEVSALLSEKDSVRNQLDIMQQNYAELLKNKEVEAAQATEAALKLQKSVDELKVLAQNKDDEIAKLQAEVVGAKKEHCADFSALLSEKDSVHNQLTVMQQDYTELLKSKKVLTQKNDHEIVILLSGKDSLHKQLVRREQDYAELLKNKKVEAAQATEAALNLQKSVHDLKVLVQKKDNEIGRLRAEAVCAKKKVHQIHSLVKEKDDGIPRLKVWHPESVQKQYKDISEIHKQSRSGDPAVTLRHKLKSGEDYISQTKIVEKDGQEETTQKHMHVYSMSNDNEKSGSDLDDDEPIGSDEDGDKQSRSNENGDKQCRSHDDGDKKSRTGDVDGQSRSNEDEHKLSGSDDETTNNQSQNPPRNPKRKRDACNAETANGKSHRKTNGSGDMSELVKFRIYHGPGTIRSNARGVDLSEFKFVDLQLPAPEKVSINRWKYWFATCLSLDTETCTVSIQAVWNSSAPYISWKLKRINQTSQWVSWLRACKHRRTHPVVLVLPMPKENPLLEGDSGYKPGQGSQQTDEMDAVQLEHVRQSDYDTYWSRIHTNLGFRG